MLPSACLDDVGTSDDSDCRAQYPAYACPCHRSTPSLAADGVWLRVGMVRYTFPVRLFHPLHSSRFLALSKARFRLDRLQVTDQLAPLALLATKHSFHCVQVRNEDTPILFVNHPDL